MGRPTRSIGFDAERLHEARRAKRLTQKELARLIGVHTVTLNRWEKGLNEPSAEQLERLAVACGRPAGYFLGEDVEDHDPDWLTDPTLNSYPLGELQKRTAAALRGLLKGSEDVTQLANVAEIPEDRMQALVSGASLPFPREIQQLRDAFGELYNPTPTLGRRIAPLAPKSASTAASAPKLPVGVYGQSRFGEASYGESPLLTPDEMQDLVLRRLNRFERQMGEDREQLQSIEQRLQAIEQRLAPLTQVNERLEALSGLLDEYLKERLGEKRSGSAPAAGESVRSGRSR